MVINTDNDPGLFEGVFQFSVQETSKDLLQNGKLIVLKPEQEVAIRVRQQDLLTIHLSDTGRRLHDYPTADPGF